MSQSSGTLNVRVARIEAVTPEIKRFTLVSRDAATNRAVIDWSQKLDPDSARRGVASIATGAFDDLSEDQARTLRKSVTQLPFDQKEATNLERSLEQIREQDLRIRTLHDALTKKDSITLALVTSLKSSLPPLMACSILSI